MMDPRDEDDRSVEELREELFWDEDGTATLPDPDEDDSEIVDRSYGREY